jgi:hypothetical protein
MPKRTRQALPRVRDGEKRMAERLGDSSPRPLGLRDTRDRIGGGRTGSLGAESRDGQADGNEEGSPHTTELSVSAAGSQRGPMAKLR